MPLSEDVNKNSGQINSSKEADASNTSPRNENAAQQSESTGKRNVIGQVVGSVQQLVDTAVSGPLDDLFSSLGVETKTGMALAVAGLFLYAMWKMA